MRLNQYIRRVGNSLTITIPYHVCQEMNLEEGDKVRLNILGVEKDEEEKTKEKANKEKNIQKKK